MNTKLKKGIMLICKLRKKKRGEWKKNVMLFFFIVH